MVKKNNWVEIKHDCPIDCSECGNTWYMHISKYTQYKKYKKKRFVCDFCLRKKAETVNFLSNFEMYDKEESGKKPNTLRISTPKLDKKMKKAIYVRIQKGYTAGCFIRKITDKTLWNGQWIISWNPNTSIPTNKN